MHDIGNVPLTTTSAEGTLGGRYRLLCAIGTTSVGVSYRGWDLKRKRAVEVELLPRDAFAAPGVRARIERSVQDLANVRDPRCVKIFDVGVSDLGSFLVREQVDAEAVGRDRVAQLPLPRALELGHEVALAIAAAHRSGVLHNALEPARVLILTGDAASPRLELSGFGLAAWISELPFEPRTAPCPLHGYLSPEHVARRTLDARSDVYSIGALLYALVTGAAPFEGGDPGDWLRRHLDEAPLPPSKRLDETSLPLRILDKIVLRCLHKVPSERYPSALDLARDLARLRTALATLAPRRPAPGRAERVIHHPPRRSMIMSRRPLPKVIINDAVGHARTSSALEGPA